jgi:hypothetical protein
MCTLICSLTRTRFPIAQVPARIVVSRSGSCDAVGSFRRHFHTHLRNDRSAFLRRRSGFEVSLRRADTQVFTDFHDDQASLLSLVRCSRSFDILSYRSATVRWQHGIRYPRDTAIRHRLINSILMPADACAARAGLSRSVVDAFSKVYSAKADLRLGETKTQPKHRRTDGGTSESEGCGSAAVRALDEHIKQHGCIG